MEKEAVISNQPLITVVIPSFNHASWIGAAIDSVLSQSYKNLEIIVIDNCSTDLTDSVLDAFKEFGIKVLKVNNLGSIAFSRNIALNEANGEWVAFLDSDDWWLPHKLYECSKYFNVGTDLIYHNLYVTLDSKVSSPSKLIKSRKLKSPVFFDLLINGNTIATSSVVVRKDLLLRIGGMREDSQLVGVEDYNTWLRIAKITDGFKLIDRYLGNYRIHSQNISMDNKFQTISFATEEFLDDLNLKQRTRMSARILYQEARYRYLHRNYKNLNGLLIEIIKSGSFRFKIRSLFMLVINLLRVNIKIKINL
jgi:glycosyltransferase involved in cell wall biosynthesis